jgi:hypothetical protein
MPAKDEPEFVAAIRKPALRCARIAQLRKRERELLWLSGFAILSVVIIIVAVAFSNNGVGAVLLVGPVIMDVRAMIQIGMIRGELRLLLAIDELSSERQAASRQEASIS